MNFQFCNFPANIINQPICDTFNKLDIAFSYELSLSKKLITFCYYMCKYARNLIRSRDPLPSLFSQETTGVGAALKLTHWHWCEQLLTE